MTKKIRMFIWYLVQDEKGATAIEYGLLAGLIAVVIIAAVTALGGGVNKVFVAACHALANVPSVNITCP
jgi:pilus assembly protein Flp/PilA